MDPFLAEIVMFGGNFAPRGWAFCDGQLLPISQYSALFSILGTTYGGDGRTTFALPDMRGRAAIHAGNGPGLSDRRLGAKGGSETNTLNTTQLPSHNHTGTGKLVVSNAPAAASDPTGGVPAVANGRVVSGAGNGGQVQVNGWGTTGNGHGANNGVAVTINNTGGNQSVNNMQPWLAINYIIALQGVFPSRS
jgi:microcystin-dependent protein